MEQDLQLSTHGRYFAGFSIQRTLHKAARKAQFSLEATLSLYSRLNPTSLPAILSLRTESQGTRSTESDHDFRTC